MKKLNMIIPDVIEVRALDEIHIYYDSVNYQENQWN